MCNSLLGDYCCLLKYENVYNLGQTVSLTCREVNSPIPKTKIRSKIILPKWVSKILLIFGALRMLFVDQLHAEWLGSAWESSHTREVIQYCYFGATHTRIERKKFHLTSHSKDSIPFFLSKVGLNMGCLPSTLVTEYVSDDLSQLQYCVLLMRH